MKEIILRGFDPDELVSLITSDVAEALEPMLTAINEPRLVDGDRMAELLSISRPTLDRAVQRGDVPSVKVGRRRLFEPRKVIDALSEASER